jgi:hypothetical protein
MNATRGASHLEAIGVGPRTACFSCLAYYLRTYHVRLPRAFVIHARNNDYQIPAVDVASLPAFEP